MTRERQHHQYDEHDIRVLIVLACVHNNSHISSPQLEREIGIPYETVLKIYFYILCNSYKSFIYHLLK